MANLKLLEKFGELVKDTGYFIPLRPWDKTPARKLTTHTSYTPTPQPLNNGTGVGFVPTHRILCLDIDNKGTPGDMATLTACLEAITGTRFKDIYTVRTPSGGIHVYFIVPTHLTHKNAFIYSGAAASKKPFFTQVCLELAQQNLLPWGHYNRLISKDFTLTFDVRNGSAMMLTVAPGSITNTTRTQMRELEKTMRDPGTDDATARTCRQQLSDLKQLPESALDEKNTEYVMVRNNRVIPPEEYDTITLPAISDEGISRMARAWGAAPDTFTRHQRKAWGNPSRAVSAIDYLLTHQKHLKGTFTYAAMNNNVLWDLEATGETRNITFTHDFTDASFTPTGHIPQPTPTPERDLPAEWVRTTRLEAGEEPAQLLTEAIQQAQTIYGLGLDELLTSGALSITSGLHKHGPRKHTNPDGVWVYEDGTTLFGDLATSSALTLTRTNNTPVVLSNFATAPELRDRTNKPLPGEILTVLVPTVRGCGGHRKQEQDAKTRRAAAQHHHINPGTIPEAHALCPNLTDKSGRHRAGAHQGITPVSTFLTTPDGGRISESRVQDWVDASGVTGLLRKAARVRVETLPHSTGQKGVEDTLKACAVVCERPGYVPPRERPRPTSSGWVNQQGVRHLSSYRNFRFTLARHTHHKLPLLGFILLVQLLGLDYDTSTAARLSAQDLVVDCARIYHQVSNVRIISSTDTDPFSMAAERYGEALHKAGVRHKKGRVYGKQQGWAKKLRDYPVFAANKDGTGRRTLTHPFTQRRLAGIQPNPITVPKGTGQYFGVVYHPRKIARALEENGYRKNRAAWRNMLRVLESMDGSFQNTVNIEERGTMFVYPHVERMGGLSYRQTKAARSALEKMGIFKVITRAVDGRPQYITIAEEFRDKEAEEALGRARMEAAAARGGEEQSVPVCAFYDRATGTVSLPYVDGTWQKWVDRWAETVADPRVLPDTRVAGVMSGILLSSCDAVVSLGWGKYREQVWSLAQDQEVITPVMEVVETQHTCTGAAVTGDYQQAFEVFVGMFPTAADLIRGLKKQGMLCQESLVARFGDTPFGEFAGLTREQCEMLFRQIGVYRLRGFLFNRDLLRFVFDMCVSLGISVSKTGQ